MANDDWKQQREQYLTKRIQGQLDWYERKSRINKNGYYGCRIVIIVCGALIPLLVGYAEGNWSALKYLAGLFGVIVSVTEGVMSLKKYRENWDSYRIAAEALGRELALYESAACEAYAASDAAAFRAFVLNVEQIMAAENKEWKANLESGAGKQ